MEHMPQRRRNAQPVLHREGLLYSIIAVCPVIVITLLIIISLLLYILFHYYLYYYTTSISQATHSLDENLPRGAVMVYLKNAVLT